MAMPWRILGRHISRDKLLRATELRGEMTPAETVVWQRLRRNGLGVHFRRQQGLDGFITDFFCHRAGVVVEIDGRVHDEQGEYDQARDEILRSEGLVVIRFTNEEVFGDLETVMDRIAQLCRRRAQEPGR